MEPLESRTLLASVWDPDFAAVLSAVSGSGDYSVAFNPRFGIKELVITGQSSTSLTVNFDTLPAFVTSVTISQFDSVTFLGTDNLNKLVASDINSLSAAGITLNLGVYSTNVGFLSLSAAGELAVLKGGSTKLDVANLDSTLIISDLQTLAILSQSPAISVVSLNSEQIVKLNYQPGQISVVGLSDASRQILLAGDDPKTPTLPGSGVVVIDIPANDRTDALLARLRELLRSTQADGPQLVFELVSSDKWLASQRGQTPLAAETGPVAIVDPNQGRQFSGAFMDIPPQRFDSLGLFFPTLGELELAGLQSGRTPTGPDESVFDWPAASAFPVATARSPDFSLMPSPGDELLPVRTTHGEFAGSEFAGISQDHDPRILKYHLLGRISAELSPGEQGAYLLVDPKPMRSFPDKNRESALHRFV